MGIERLVSKAVTILERQHSLPFKSKNWLNAAKKLEVKGLTYAQKLKGDVAQFNRIPAQRVFSAGEAAAPKVEKVIQPGLSEIVVEQRIAKGGGILKEGGGGVSHPSFKNSPIPPKGEKYIEVNGQYLTFPDGPNGPAVRYEIIDKPNGEKWVKFFDKNDSWVGKTEKCKPTAPITDKNAIRKMLEEGRGKPSVPPEPLPEITEPHFQGFKQPKGTHSCFSTDIRDGRIIEFADKEGRILREIKCDKSGYPIEYTNYEYLKSDIKGQVKKLPDGTYSPIEGKATYNDTIRSSTYKINDDEVLSTLQKETKIFHDSSKIHEPVTTTVRRSGPIEDVILESNGKRTEQTFFTLGDNHKGRLVGDGLTRGFTKEELEIIKSDPYLSARYYNNPVDFLHSSKPIAFKKEGIRNPDMTTLTFKQPEGCGSGYYNRNKKNTLQGLVDTGGGQINFTPIDVKRNNKSWLTNILSHETRHGKQYDLVEDLNHGRLSGELKKEAETYKYGFDNYTQPDVNFERYMNNPVEVDARRAGDEAARIFDNFGEKINRMFRN